MTHKLTVRFGGASDSEVHDYSDRVRLYNSDGSRSIHGGMRCDNGSASSGEFELLDEQNLIPHGDADGLQIAAHNQVIWSEDSPGYEAWLSIGRVSPKNVERPYDRTAGVARTWVTQFDDANMDIDGITLTTDEARPAETDVDRILWALGAFCDGDPRLTTVFATDLVSTAGAVTMPAKTYEAGTELDEIFQDCASTAGKIYAVVIHEDDDEAGDHTCFLYIDEEDHTTYACTLSISDQLADVDGETVFEPHWRQGAATTEDGQDLQTGIVSRYGMDTTATVVVTDTDHADAYDYWVKPYFDDVSETATQATNRATALLHARWNEHLTHTPSILIPARLHNLVRAGMSIGIRSAAAMGGQYLNTTQTRRIAQIEWEPAGRRGDDELLWANLQLDRPRRVLGAGSGTKPGPKPPTQGSAPSIVRSGGAYGLGGALGPVNMVIDGGGDDMIVVFVVTLNTQDVTAVKYTPNVTFPGTTESFTQIGSDVTVGTDPIPRVTAWKLYEPSASTGSGRISLTLNGTNAPGAMFVRYIAGVTNTTPSSQSGSTVGTSVSTTLAGVGTGHLVLDGLGWGATHTAALTAAEGADQTEDYQDGTAGQSGIPDAVLASSHQLGSAGGVMSWSSIPASANYTGAAHLVVGVLGVDGDSPPPAADDGTGDIGTGDGCYATCDHKHPVQTAAVTPITDTAGNFTAGNVEGALAELADDVAAGGSTLAEVVGSSDLMSSWWVVPKAVEHDGYVHVGGVTSAGVQKELVIRLADWDVTEFTLATNEQDDHIAPALLVPDGKARIAAYARHAQDAVFRYRIASGTGATASYGAEQTFTITGDDITYVQAYQRPDTDELYFLVRAGVTGEGQRYWTMLWSDDYLATDPSEQRVFDFGSGDQGYIVTAQLADDSDTLRVAMTGNPDSDTSSIHDIYVALINLDTGAVTKLDGTSLGNFKTGSSLPIVVTSECDKAVDTDTAGGDTARLFDVGDGDAFEIAYADGTEANTTDFTYRYTAYDGSAWQSSSIVLTGDVIGYTTEAHYQGGAMFPRNTPGHELVLAREASGTWYVERYTKGTSAWVSQRLATADAGDILARPFPVLNGSLIGQFWHKVTAYTDYTDWAGSLVAVQDGGQAVSAGAGATDLNGLSDVTITAAADGDLLRYNGTAWVDANERNTGHWELAVSGSGPPVAVTNNDADDFVYGWVTG